MNTWQQSFPQLQPLEPDVWLQELLSPYHHESLRQHWPAENAPPAISWESETAPKAPLPLDTTEKKAVQAFGYVLTHQKKSSKYFKQIQALHDKFHSEDLAEMMLTYALQWQHPEAAESFGQELLQIHPDSLGLRLNLGLLALSQQEAPKILALLDQALDWPTFCQQHPNIQASTQNLRTYHTLTCLYFTATAQFYSAIYAWACCRGLQAEAAELRTLSREILRQFPEAGTDLHQWLQACA